MKNENTYNLENNLKENDAENIAKSYYDEALQNSVGVEPVLVRTAKSSKKNKLIRNDMITLSMSAVVILALSVHMIDHNIFPSLVAKVFGDKHITKYESELDYHVEEEPVQVNVNDQYNIGGRFILDDDAKIYTNYEYAGNPESPAAKEDADTAYYVSKLGMQERQTLGIGFLMPDGSYKFAHNEEEEKALEEQGGVTVSLQGFDGFYNVDNVTEYNDDEDYKVGGR